MGHLPPRDGGGCSRGDARRTGSQRISAVASKDPRAYLDGLPVGLIVTAWGWQATGSTLATLRSIVHALRGWPTPLGAAINTSQAAFEKGECSDPGVAGQLEMVGRQVQEQARLRLKTQH